MQEEHGATRREPSSRDARRQRHARRRRHVRARFDGGARRAHLVGTRRLPTCCPTNAGVGAQAAKPWESTPNDWRWVFGVNVLGVANGVGAFVPRMIDDGHEGRVINTSSPNGGLSNMPTAAVYAASKAAVSSYTETLQNQFIADDLPLRASVFYPSGGLLETGLFESDRRDPEELARERPRTTPAMSVETLEKKAEEGGYELPWQDLNELARAVLAGIREERFVIMLDVSQVGDQLHARARPPRPG
ncbi:MAG: SDR family NAD(P)-dependent oxidoreductase [Acidimicrobiales bacterium]|nr:SDR family NAD(P)-dependent oxidoreductase [Acidimicrobiales bacterium]